MVRAEGNFEAEDVRQNARHTLFVEGDEASIDFQALKYFFEENGIFIPIEPLTSSSKIGAVASALHPSHRNYYFLIDRDHHSIEEVKSSWRNFPDENTRNLLIWPRREIENYFLVPEYLVRSPYCECSLEELRQCIRETASKRVFLDIANIVILKLKKELDKELNENWFERFKDKGTAGFVRRDIALKKLEDKYKVAKQTCSVLKRLHGYPILDHFNEIAKEFFLDEDDKRELDGEDKLEFGRGIWLEMIRGKHVLPTVINYKNKYFRAKDREGKYLQGEKLCIEVAKSLLRLPLEDQPDDFQELHKLISTRVLKRSGV